MRQTAQWANLNPALSAAILTKYTKVALRPETIRITYATKLSTPQVQPVIDVAAQNHVLKAPFPVRQIFSDQVESGD